MAHQFFFNPFILDNLPAPDSGFDVVQDISEPRLRMYITSRGVKSFFVRKRIRGKDKRIIIGNYPEVDIETARASVQSILEKACQKIPVRHKKITMKKFISLYVSNKVKRNINSLDKLERAIKKHLKDLLDKNISDISLEDVKSVIDKIEGKAIAGRMQELLQSIFRYALDTGFLKVIEKEDDQNLRATFLMLIYGFAPKSKIFSMQWKDLDFNHYTWGDMPLSDNAVVLLQDLPQDSCWVFPSRGNGHITDPRLAWKRVVEKAGISNLTMDDVHKFLMRQLIWASDKETFRRNMNSLLDELIES